jgi:negative regulator of flagellin synthesis FlgM
MKIGPMDIKALQPSGSERAASAKAAPAPAAPVGASTEVRLAASAQAFAAAQAEPAFDAAKVERMATAIREGRFEVNAGAIADKLIANAQELLSRSRS